MCPFGRGQIQTFSHAGGTANAVERLDVGDTPVVLVHVREAATPPDAANTSLGAVNPTQPGRGFASSPRGA
jgi:hypothetical protein